MKNIRKLFAFALTFAMAFAIALPAFAQDNGTITIENAQVDAEYSVYKLFDATVGTDGSIAYTLPANKTVLEGDAFYTYFNLVNGNVTEKSTLTEQVLKSEEFKTWARDFGEKQGNDVKATSSTVKFENLPYGYYFVKSTVGTTLTVNSTNPSASVIDKNEEVTFDKNIVLSGNMVKVNEAGLNIPVDFDIKVETKNYYHEEKIFKYVVNDNMDKGFSLTEAPVVKVGNKTLKSADNEYTITYTKDETSVTNPFGADAFEITIPWTSDGTKGGDFLYDNNADLNVTYTAILDPDKAADVNTGNTPNENTAVVKFYKGTDIPDSNKPSGTLPEKVTETYATALTITKKDGSNNILTGAQFTLTSTNGTKVILVTGTKYVLDAKGTYYKLDDGTYTDEKPNGIEDHDAVYDSTETTYKMVIEAMVKGDRQADTTVAAYVGADGKVTFKGLGTGTYMIEETEVPAGYNKAANITFDVTFNAKTKTFASDNVNVVLDGTTGLFETTVVNQKGTTLPSTGGIGTTIFYIVGGVMVAGAAIFLLTKRRMSGNAE